MAKAAESGVPASAPHIHPLTRRAAPVCLCSGPGLVLWEQCAETQTQVAAATCLPHPRRSKLMPTYLSPHLVVPSVLSHLLRVPRYLATPQESRGNFCSYGGETEYQDQGIFLERGWEALTLWWGRVSFKSGIQVPRWIGRWPRRKEALLFRLNNSLLVGKGIINPSWSREPTFPLLFHSNLISWHEFLTWVAFLPRLVAPGRGWLFKTAGSSCKAYNLMINACRQLPLLAGPSPSLIDTPGDLGGKTKHGCFFERISCLWMQEKDKKFYRRTAHRYFPAYGILQGGIPFMHSLWNRSFLCL